LRLSDRIAVFSKGVIDQIGTGPELYANPATRFVAEFIGDSNFLDGEIISVDGKLAELKLANGELFSGIPIHGKAGAGGHVSLMLRPERIDLARPAQNDRPALSGKVKDITFLGNNTHVLVEGAGQTALAVRVPFGNPELQGLAKGDDVLLRWKAETAHAFCL
jgi:putative spermidine/putrescine transport system ATP-binding protein